MSLLITELLWPPQLKYLCAWFYFWFYRCTCADGFEGENCEINVDDCEDNDCENNSTCVDGINNYTCLCPPEYTGRSIREREMSSRKELCFCMWVNLLYNWLKAKLPSIILFCMVCSMK